MLNSCSAIAVDIPSIPPTFEIFTQARTQQDLTVGQTTFLKPVGNDYYQLFSKIITHSTIKTLFENGQILTISSADTPFTPQVVQECIEEATQQTCELFSISYSSISEKIELTPIETSLRHLFIMDQLSLRATGLTKPPSNKAYLYNLLVTKVKKSPLLNREMLNHLLISASAQAEFRINKRVRDLQSCIREQGGHDKLFNKIEQINNTYARTLCYRSITNELIKLSLLSKYATNSVLPPAHTTAPPSSYASVLPVSPIALSGSPTAAEFSQPSPFIESLFSDPVWPYTPSDSFSTLDELDTSFTFIESLFNDIISPNFYASVDNSSPLSESFTPAPNGFLGPLSQLPLSPIHSTTHSLPSTQDFKKETSPLTLSHYSSPMRGHPPL